MIKDDFSFGVEIDLSKSRVDENGDVIIEGIASSADEDIEGHTIVPTGWDLSYFLRKGFLKWEHSKDPRNFVGEPLEARATKAGLYVKGRLYGGLPKTQEIVELMDGMKKSQAGRKIGMSIEGQALARDPDNPNKITKAVLRNVALTANPVNDTTWVDLCKSLTSKEALSVELDQTEMLLKQALGRPTVEQLEKALSTDSPGGAVLQPESLEQDDDQDPKKRRQKIIDSFRKFIQMYLQKSTLTKSLNLATREGAAGFAVGQGLNESEAEEFAALIDQNTGLLKALGSRVAGGELSMSQVTDELQKSLDALAKLGGEAAENPVEEPGDNPVDDLFKSIDNEDDEDDDYEDDDADEDDDDEDDEDDDEDDEEDSELTKSLMSEDETVEEAFEVSAFLRSITNQVGHKITGFEQTLEKSLATQSGVNAELVKSLGAIGKAVVELHKRAEDAETQSTKVQGAYDQLVKSHGETLDLVKSLTEKMDVLMNTPVGRKGVTNQRELITLNKSMGDDQGQPLNRAQIEDILVKGITKGELDRMEITRFETQGIQGMTAKGRQYLQNQLGGAVR